MAPKSGVCDGSCCERFFLPLKPDEVWSYYEEYLRGEREDKHADIKLIGPMVIPLDDEGLDGEDAKRGFWYTCKHWDKDTRLCKIYEFRPKMCRDYPYISPCVYCGWVNEEYIEEQKEKLLPPGPVHPR